MKKLLMKISMVALVAIIAIGCRKNDSLESSMKTFDQLEAKYASSTQTFFVNGATGGTITLKEGTKITLGPNFARTAAGAVVTNQVTVQAMESRKKSQWIADGLSTTTPTSPLVSGGMLNLRVLDPVSGNELVKNPAADVAVIMPPIGQPDSAMRLFLPVQGPVGGNTTTPPTAWQQSTAAFTVNANGYSFNLPQFGWANCDRLYNVPGTKTTVNVRVSGNTGATNHRVIFVYKNINTLINLTTIVQTNQWASYTNSIPVGSVADVVYIAKAPSGRVFFKSITGNTFTANQVIDLAADEVDASVVDAYLSSL